MNKYPVKIRPINSWIKLSALAMSAQPMTQGMAANLTVFSRPNHSINTAEMRHPTGTDKTIIDAFDEKIG